MAAAVAVVTAVVADGATKRAGRDAIADGSRGRIPPPAFPTHSLRAGVSVMAKGNNSQGKDKKKAKAKAPAKDPKPAAKPAPKKK